VGHYIGGHVQDVTMEDKVPISVTNCFAICRVVVELTAIHAAVNQ
jgi:hypothetical protein